MSLSKMTLDDCGEETKKHNVPDDIGLCFDSLYSNHTGKSNDLALTYPGGRKYSVGDIENILLRAYGIAGVEYGGVRPFYEFISRGSEERKEGT